MATPPKGPIVLQPGLLLGKAQYSPNPDTADHPENVMWWQSANTAAVGLADLSAIAAVFDGAWSTMFHNYGATGKTYTGSIWTDYSTQFGLTYSSVGTLVPVFGTQGTPFPPHTAILISLKIQERYRGGHGRIYLPWAGESVLDGTDSSKILGTMQTTIQGNYAQVGTAMAASGHLGGQTQKVYRQKQTPGSAHLMSISQSTVQLVLATQRRRLRKAPHH